MNSLRVKSKTLYEIEVNDNGDTIALDPSDVELPLKLQRTVDKITEIENQYNEDVARIEEEYKDRKDEKEDGAFLTKREIALFELIERNYKEIRRAIDLFLGEGACQKIFGDYNTLTMFDDLMDALAPHLEEIGVRSTSLATSIEEKYKKDAEDVL